MKARSSLGERHEKDDRSRIDDRRTYVLGWTNERKIDALIADASRIQAAITDVDGELVGPRDRRDDISHHLSDLRVLRERERWDDLDWISLDGQRRQLEDEADRIRSSSDVLRSLTAELEAAGQRRKAAEARRNELGDARGRIGNQHDDAQAQHSQVQLVLADEGALAGAREVYDDIERSIPEGGRDGLTDLRQIHAVEVATLGVISASRTAMADRQATTAQRAVKAMRDFRYEFAREADELDDSMASAGEYRQLRERVATDDLPRFEGEFRRSLKENTINEIAGFVGEPSEPGEHHPRSHLADQRLAPGHRLQPRPLHPPAARTHHEHRDPSVSGGPPGVHEQHHSGRGRRSVFRAPLHPGEGDHRPLQGPRGKH